MNAKELEIIKKLFKIATNQQKLIVKLAQGHAGINPLDPNAPIGSAQGDPLADGLTDTRTKEQVTQDVYKNFPWLHPTAPKGTAPVTPAQTSAPASTLDPSYKQMIDRVAPGLKGNLHVTVDGRNVHALFNNAHAYTANQVKALLTKAFPGFFIEVIGEQNPRWIANY